MNIGLGNFFLTCSWILSLYGLVIGSWAALTNRQGAFHSTRVSVHLSAICSGIALIYLGYAFITHDYSYVYVWQTSNNAMHPVYLFTAIWGGMDGSMLLWVAFMGLFSAIVVANRGDNIPQRILNWLVPVTSGGNLFFLIIVTFLTNPFRTVPNGAALIDGNGLNPLLQNPSMAIHPPLLYLGFTGFFIPAAFCIAALLSGQLSNLWIQLTRRWTLIAWGFLTIGIILGGNWAYIELGWGGFWAWDPVENASFMPWLTGTAFLHSVMVQQQRGMLKMWNIWLSVGTYLLCVFGTFLTRSGVVQSVHAFAETDIGWVFLLYIGLVFVLTLYLVIRHRVSLKPEHKIQSYFSREAAFLFNNLILLAVCFATFWGVMFPVISEAFVGEKSVIGPPFFNAVNVPLFLVMLFLMGVGPLIAWRKSSLSLLRRVFLKPFIVASVVTIIFLIIDPSRILSAISFGLCVFVFGTVSIEMRRGINVQRQITKEASSVATLFRRKPRRYGGLLIHVGVAVMAIAITAAMAYKIEKDLVLRVGEKAKVGPYTLLLEDIVQQNGDNYNGLIASFKVSNDEGNLLATLKPERRYYPVGDQATTEVDIRMTLVDDLYIAFAGMDLSNVTEDKDIKTAAATFKVYVNPLQVWVWIGAVIILIGTAVVMDFKLLFSRVSSVDVVKETHPS